VIQEKEKISRRQVALVACSLVQFLGFLTIIWLHKTGNKSVVLQISVLVPWALVCIIKSFLYKTKPAKLFEICLAIGLLIVAAEWFFGMP